MYSSIKLFFYPLLKVPYLFVKNVLEIIFDFLSRPKSLKYLHYKVSYPELWKMIDGFHYASKHKILIFGDSVSLRTAKEDKDLRTLGDIICEILPNDLNARLLTHSAYNLEMYSYLTEVLFKLNNKPEYIIIPINIRSFSPQWFLKPEWKFEREIKIIHKFLGQSYNSNIKTEEEFLSTHVEYPLTDIDQIGKFQKVIEKKVQDGNEQIDRKRLIFIYHYLNKLTQNHELIKFFIRLIKVTKEANVKIFFYITPINIESGTEFVGKDFSQIVKNNINQLMDIFISNQHKNVSLHNYYDLLTKESFFNNQIATEHLNESGRIKLANKIKDDFIL